MPRNSTWTNQDGLVVGFGGHTSDNNVGAAQASEGPVKTYRKRIVGTLVPSLAATAADLAAAIPPQEAAIRRGSVVTRAVFQVDVPFEGTSSTLTLGTYSLAGADDDVDGIDAGIVLTAIDGIGDIVRCDGASTTGLVALGTVSDSDVYVIPGWGTNAFTAGEGTLIIEYIEPAFTDPLAV